VKSLLRMALVWRVARRPDLVYKKVDSVLRGWVRPELEELLGGLGWARALIVPANPGLGRVISPDASGDQRQAQRVRRAGLRRGDGDFGRRQGTAPIVVPLVYIRTLCYQMLYQYPVVADDRLQQGGAAVCIHAVDLCAKTDQQSDDIPVNQVVGHGVFQQRIGIVGGALFDQKPLGPGQFF